MSVATKNPFALLDDDAPAAPTVVEKKEASAPAPAATRGTQKTRGGPAARGGKYYARGGKPQTSKDSPAGEDVAPEGQKKFEGAREGRGRGRGGRGRGGDRPSRGRPFDRHSQTGKTDSDKKIHQSWGGDDGTTELKAEEAATTDAAAEWGTPAPTGDVDAWATSAAATADAWATPADAETPEGEAKPEGRSRREREPEEEDNTLTLDQYLAQQKEKDSAIPKIDNTRKANEGAEDDLWKDAVALSKNEEEEAYYVGKTKTAAKGRAEKKEKVFIEIDARFERPDRGGRGRGGRGGDRGGDRARAGRGGRGRGGRQNGGSAAPVVNVDDQTAFPSLS